MYSRREPARSYITREQADAILNKQLTMDADQSARDQCSDIQPTWKCRAVGNDATPRWEYAHFWVFPKRPDKIGRDAHWVVQRAVGLRTTTYDFRPLTLDAAKREAERLWMEEQALCTKPNPKNN